MKNFKTMILLGVVALSVVSCKKGVVGVGPAVTQTRPVTSFTGIDLRMAGDVHYKNEATPKLEIIAQQNILNMIDTYIADGKLVIKFNGNYDESDAIRINVSGPAVSNFALTTAGSIYCANELQVPNLWLTVKGSGSLSLQNVVTGNIEALNEGSGDISINSGTAVSEQLRSRGSGKIELGGIAARTVTAKTSGSGSIRVKPSEQLNATVEGSGSIYFTGNPNVSSHVSGSGHLIHL